MSQPLTDEPRDLLLGPDGDLVITTDFEWVRGIEAVAQSCRIALMMFAGEWFLDLDAGIPYWQSILGRKPAVALAAAQVAFRSELMSVSGVLEVLRLDVAYVSSTRAMTVTFKVRTGLGETPVITIVPPIGAG